MGNFRNIGTWKLVVAILVAVILGLVWAISDWHIGFIPFLLGAAVIVGFFGIWKGGGN